jgi:hypothetical protein
MPKYVISVSIALLIVDSCVLVVVDALHSFAENTAADNLRQNAVGVAVIG